MGVTFLDNLSPQNHINKITGETYNLLRKMRMAVTYLDRDRIRKLIALLLRPRLEHTAVIWSLHKKKDVL